MSISAAADRAERRRLMILQLMVEDGGQANENSLLTAMRAMGETMDMSQDACRALMRDLAARDCLSIDMVRDTVMVGRITERGRMAVSGDAEVGGVASPYKGL